MLILTSDGLALGLAEYSSDAYAEPSRKTALGIVGNGLSVCSFLSPTTGVKVLSFTRPLKGASTTTNGTSASPSNSVPQVQGKSGVVPSAISADVFPGAKASVAWAVGDSPGLAYHGPRRGVASVVW